MYQYFTISSGKIIAFQNLNDFCSKKLQLSEELFYLFTEYEWKLEGRSLISLIILNISLKLTRPAEVPINTANLLLTVCSQYKNLNDLFVHKQRTSTCVKKKSHVKQ